MRCTISSTARARLAGLGADQRGVVGLDADDLLDLFLARSESAEASRSC